MDRLILGHESADDLSERLGYLPIEFLGGGTEGEVYKAVEKNSQAVCALKFFFPAQNKNLKRSSRIAQKLFRLRDCPLVPAYFGHQTVYIGGERTACLATEFVKGEPLEKFVNAQRGKRLNVFPALHLLYSLAKGVEAIHKSGEYHGDLHLENVIIKNFGLDFDLSIFDLHHWGDSKQANRDEDIVKCIHIFHETLGGARYYSTLPPSIRFIIAGRKRSLIKDRFKTASHLRRHLENMDWSDAL